MRKFNKFAYASAMLLAGGMVLASCSSDDELTNANPTYDGESVKAQFAISVPGYAVNGSRMTAGEAQEKNVFNGIENLQLFPLKLATAGDTAVAATTLGYSPIWLGEISSSSEFLSNTTNPSWNPTTQANVKRYTDLKLGLGINAFLVYGKAKHVDGSSDAEDQLIASYDVSALTTASTANDINFSLVPRYKAAAQETATLTALNEITTELLHISGTGYDLLQGNVKKMMAGSSASVLAMVEDLWNSSARLDNSRGTTSADVAGYALRAKIKNYFSVTENTLGENDELSWNTNPDFPKVANLPDGAVAVKFDTVTNLFGYSASIDLEGPSDVPARDNYVLPAQLYYRSNTPIRVKDATVFETESHYKGKTWEQILTDNYNTTGNAVIASTRSVVLEKELQYAVADMATQVKVSTATIKDSKGNIVSIPAGGLKVTGILVGDQKNVDFKFQPKGSTAYTLYDNTVQDADGNDCMAQVSATTYSSPNHTLVLETAAGASVRVAVEFQNTGSDFYGYKGQLIPAGGKFYLIAELDPAAAGATAPGEYTSLNQVFKQDFTTVVKLNITSLAKAYNVIPDLRAPQLEFGMSVDLKWQTGMKFEVDFN